MSANTTASSRKRLPDFTAPVPGFCLPDFGPAIGRLVLGQQEPPFFLPVTLWLRLCGVHDKIRRNLVHVPCV